MSFLEWRRFSFFDVLNNIDNGKIAECLQDTNVTVSTSGHNHVILCDLTGWAHRISRSWEITSFKAYELTITLAQQLPHDPYLVTIGDDEAGTNPLIKVWDWSRVDKHGNPKCVRTSRAVPSHMYPTAATALAVHDNKNLLAVGFQDGSVSLYRGDITRQKGSKMKSLPGTGNSPITRLAFKGADKLFIVSRASVSVCTLGVDTVSVLDAMGAAPGCSVLADTRRLTVAAADAIYCYTSEGRGPCYALKGEKVKLNWFRSYLVITTNEASNEPSGSGNVPKAHHLTILDIQNKFIVFSKTFDEIDAVLTEWGSFYIITKKKEMIYLDEKDLQSKLFQLFKKNLYDVAIRIASSQHYDAEGLTEIYKQYGDHLYGKGDFKGAIDQYVKTIGWLETSYVIRKYLESRHLEPLVQYLEELHKKGYATEDHTTLLLTCYVKIDQHDQEGKLKEFINSKDKAIDFDVDVAIKVVRQVSIEDALSLAQNHKRHDWYLKMMIEDKKEYTQALDYIAELEFEDAEIYIKKYGHKLIQHAPNESTKLLKNLCTDYKPRSKPLIDESSLSGGYREPDRASPDDFIHMFLTDSTCLIHFLEHVTADRRCSKLVYNTLIEHYIHVWSKSSDDDKIKFEDKVMALLKDPEANYDKDQTLIICQMLGFKTGILHIYEERKLWRGQAALYLRGGRAERALELCRRRGASCPRLWLDVLWAPPPAALLPPLLRAAAEENLLSPIEVVECLASTTLYTLGDVRNYLMAVLKAEDEVITNEQTFAAKYQAEIEQMKEDTRRIQQEPLTFQSSRCAACKRPLELPTVHFLCRHSFHQHCFQTYSELETECPACEEGGGGGAGRSVRRAPPPPADQLHARLEADNDPFTVVSEYLGRGLFNKVVVTEPEASPPVSAAPELPRAAAPAPAPLNYGPGAEAKLRLQEGQSKQMFMSNTAKQVPPKGTTVIPVPEGRMRVLEQQQYSSSLEANLKTLEPAKSESPMVHRKFEEKQKISAVIANDSKNPFDENYDESKNPFADEDDDSKNPFAEDDYDKNLNPFS
ncbi:vacuolar protein sorting-associated protein 11 homolog [Aricia agestis]|uniref:vacuolar protein sorting-associated protein 11 homolog n=1 Tax=Aricia agestis TaxID=91739 RepID=UPI001C20A329|nr:vacuolar protein sorting-associated protein 11 homolog [Aricia agestis]